MTPMNTPLHSESSDITSVPAETIASSATSKLRALVRTARPRQWIKNGLLFAAPAAAGVMLRPVTLTRVLILFAAYCLAASGTYFINDALDVRADRLHPQKRLRPVASGLVTTGLAKVVGLTLVAGGLGVSALLNDLRGVLILGLYVALSLSYSLWLKKVAVVDLAAVASGFLIRAVAGGVAARVPISEWFLIVAAFGSLFIVAGKRHAEHLDLGDDRADHRATLGQYTASFLRHVRSTSSAVAVTAYCLWAFDKAGTTGGPIWFQLSILPFVLVILRYTLLLEEGGGGAPEDIVLSDRPLQLMGAFLILLLGLGIYAG